MNLSQWIKNLKKAQQAASILRTVSPNTKNKVLEKASQLLIERKDKILNANQKDLKTLKVLSQSNPKKYSSAFKDRLLLTPERIASMALSLKQVSQLPDPVEEKVEERTLPNGLKIQKVRSPLGVIFMIFESRPNVAIEAFSLAFKSGNVILLKGGKESKNTVQALYDILRTACISQGLPENCFWGIQEIDRKTIQFLLQQKQWIDVVIPRGGDSLIEFVTENSKIPIIKNDRGLCHIYVHSDADLNMATKIILNAKTQRPGVCNAMETLLVHQDIASHFLEKLYPLMEPFQIEWKACSRSKKLLKGKKHISPANKESWNQEYLDFIMNCKVVQSEDEAIQHIHQYGSKHSESIVTKSPDVANRFQKEVDAAVVYWNASTRFTDGFELGLGGEIGISTQKLHVRGPVGLRELTSVRWIITGNGQIRT